MKDNGLLIVWSWLLSYALLFVFRQHTLAEIVLSIVLTVIGIVIYYTSGEFGALFHLTFIVGMFGIKGFKVWKGAYYTII